MSSMKNIPFIILT